MLDIIIPVKDENKMEDLKKTVNSIINHQFLHIILIVNNEKMDIYKDNEQVTTYILKDKTLNAMRQFGVNVAKHQYITFCNPGMIINNGTLLCATLKGYLESDVHHNVITTSVYYNHGTESNVLKNENNLDGVFYRINFIKSYDISFDVRNEDDYSFQIMSNVLDLGESLCTKEYSNVFVNLSFIETTDKDDCSTKYKKILESIDFVYNYCADYGTNLDVLRQSLYYLLVDLFFLSQEHSFINNASDIDISKYLDMYYYKQYQPLFLSTVYNNKLIQILNSDRIDLKSKIFKMNINDFIDSLKNNTIEERKE